MTAGGNLLFRADARFPQEDEAIREAWQRFRGQAGPDAVRMQCLVTGWEEENPATHPAIKGVRDAQSSGAALVSFNAPAFCSYGREQNFNAPVGKYAAFAYTAALNHLLADGNNVQHIGDTTVVCWAEGADPAYQNFAMAAFFGADTGLSDNDLRSALRRLAEGLPCVDLGIDPDRPFYILGLAPNAARLTVRFFLREAVILRIRAEHNITWAQAAILKAYLQKNSLERKNDKKERIAEVAQVQLNEECNDMPYVLGRLFRVMEEIQLASADWKLNTIKDSYFNAAAATPANAFAKLFPLSSYHLKKLMRDKTGLGRKLEDMESQLVAKLTSTIPARFTQDEVNCFYIGYYHQENREEENHG